MHDLRKVEYKNHTNYFYTQIFSGVLERHTDG
jgi:hypothetical protein